MNEALERLEPLLGSFARPGEPSTAFAALGELLFWICALDKLWSETAPTYDAARKANDAGKSIQGLRYARNQIAHGVEVTVMTEIDPENSVLDLMVLDQAKLDTPATLLWLARSKLPEVPQRRRSDGQEKAYDDYISGRSVRGSLTAASTWIVGQASADLTALAP